MIIIFIFGMLMMKLVRNWIFNVD